MEVTLKQVNEILSDLEGIRRSWNKRTGYSQVNKEILKEIMEGGEQGENGEYTEVYSTPLKDLYLKFQINTDSYGDNEYITSVQFCHIITKEVQVYEPIK